MQDNIRNIDEYSGNPIRKTDNTMRDEDIFAPQGKEPLPTGESGLPIWWENVKAKRGDVDGNR